MGLVIRGRYWRDSKTYMAEIPSIKVSSQGLTADECLGSLKKKIEEMVGEDGFKCDIELSAGSVFNVLSTDPERFERFLFKRISGIGR